MFWIVHYYHEIKLSIKFYYHPDDYVFSLILKQPSQSFKIKPIGEYLPGIHFKGKLILPGLNIYEILN